MLHMDRDDLGNGGNSGSLTTGNAGARVDCCIISGSGDDNNVNWYEARGGASHVVSFALVVTLASLVSIAKVLAC